jgi:adenine-specific DNA methylase/very-short-patch-repair endonuclease
VERGAGREVRSPIPGYIYELARKLRARQTPTEDLLWEALRDRQLGGYKFRRQHPLGRYIADFYCADASLVVEIDGAAHAPSDQQVYDRVRDEALAARGLRLIRMPADVVEHHLEQALATIAAALHLTPGPSPLPREGNKETRPLPPLHSVERGSGGEVAFFIQADVPQGAGSASQRAAHDNKLGGGTMSRSGATCPCCNMVMTTEDIRLEGQAGRLGSVMTAVVVDGPKGKEYRLPIEGEITAAMDAHAALEPVFAEIPFGLPEEPTPTQSQFSGVANYGMLKWSQIFAPRQLLALGTFVKHTRAARQAMVDAGYPSEWEEAVGGYLALAIDRVANRASSLCIWNNFAQEIEQTFARFALPILWDFAESNPPFGASGNYASEIERIYLVCAHLTQATTSNCGSDAQFQSAIRNVSTGIDVIVTDPPYYDAIPYSDLMDFFYVCLRRTLHGLSPAIDAAFSTPLSPKWNHDTQDGELIDDASRFGGDKARSKAAYEDGMARAFQACHAALAPDGRLVIVFAHKQPDVW